MHFQQVLLAILPCIVTLVGAHKGMIDDDKHRDVGIAFNKPNFEGEHKAIFEVKGESECLPLGEPVYSITICKEDVKCTFYTGTNCHADTSNYAVTIGCGDIANIQSMKGNFFGYYSCGDLNGGNNANSTLPTVPHDPSNDKGVRMGV